MTSPIVDFSEIDLTGSVKFEDQQIGSVYYNGERLWPFGVDLLYTGGIGGASHLPDPGDVYGASALAAFGDGVSAVLDEKNGTPVLGPELVVNGDGTSTVGWNVAAGLKTFESVGGEFRAVANGGTLAEFSRLVTLQIGRLYLVSAKVRSPSGNSVANLGRLKVEGGVASNFAAQTLVEDQSVVLSGVVRATGTSTRVYVAVSTQSVWGADNDEVYADDISVREISGIHALQPSASLRPLLGRAPKERRNRLIWTEDFANAAWSKNAIIPTVTVDTPSPAIVAYDLIETAVNVAHSLSHGFGFVAGVQYTISARAKYAGRHFQIVPGNTIVSGGYAAFDLQNGVVGNLVGTGMTSAIEALGDGWYLCSATFTSASTNTSSPALALVPSPTSARLPAYTGDGTSGIKLAGPQFEVGSAVSPYQRVGAATDITEDGVPSYPFVRFDLSDDVLVTTLPQAVTGDVVIAGRNGSVIAPHSYAANTTFQLGPTSYTGGTPGILRAIGDVVGWSILGKTLTAAERERLMRFYKRRGAKGLLVAGGPELRTAAATVNGGWPESGGIVTAPGTGGTTDNVTFALSSPTVAGRFYEVLIPNNMPGGSFYVDFGSGTGSQVGALGSSTQRIILTCTASGSVIRVGRWTGSPTGTIGPISVREIRPEEEW